VNTLHSGTVTIAGGVNDASGLPLVNDKMRLFRVRHYLETSTDASGHYAFPNLAAASYLLLPKGHECHFLLLDVALNKLTSSIPEDRQISLPQPVDFAGN
jgi:hypothetical protein